ncbi:MAG: hypothetical protein GY906_08760 [bacterium]|nr:hypothetical protein [bacterium]
MRALKDSNAGFSILELVVAMSLVLIAVLAACQLIVESMSIIESTGRSLRDPSTGLASASLRRDIHEAASVSSAVPGWSYGPMTLWSQWPETVIIEKVDDSLVRVVRDTSNQEIERRVLVRGIRSWRWIVVAPGLIDCELTFKVHLNPVTASLVKDPERLARMQTRVERFRFALRGQAGGNKW